MDVLFLQIFKNYLILNNADFRALNVLVEYEQKGVADSGADESDKSFALTVYVDR